MPFTIPIPGSVSPMRTRTCRPVPQATRIIAIGPDQDRPVAGNVSRTGFGPTKFGRRHALPADECTAEIPETVVAEQECNFLQAELARLHALNRQRVAHAFEDLSIRRSVVGQSPVVAMIPPLWHRLMIPKGLAWDRIPATEPERRLAADANARSGMTEFVAAA